MSNPENISDPDSTDPKLSSRSSSNEVTISDRTQSDLNELSDHLRNVGLDEATKKLSVPITFSAGNEERDSRALVSDQKEKEEEVEGSEKENTIQKRMIVYPVRPDAEDCSLYMRTYRCRYISSCKFNHPVLGNFKPIQTLSGGHKQRVAIVGAFAEACKVLLLDELTTFLDESDQITDSTFSII